MKVLRFIALILLFFTLIGALPAGYSLITDPTGNGVGLPHAWIERTPFSDFLIPGIILFSVNGIFCLMVAIMTLFRWCNFTILIVLQGGLLTGWIACQVILTRMFHPFQLLFVLIGLALIVIGYRMHMKIKQQQHY